MQVPRPLNLKPFSYYNIVQHISLLYSLNVYSIYIFLYICYIEAFTLLLKIREMAVFGRLFANRSTTHLGIYTDAPSTGPQRRLGWHLRSTP